MKPMIALSAAMMLVGCANQQLQPPTQPTPASIGTTIAGLGALPSDPAVIWADGDYAVRAGCHAYLNTAAMKAAGMAQLGIGAGALGAGLSVINPLAGVASSLFQTTLSGYGAAAALPYTTETATIIESAFDAYEASAPVPTSVGQAMSMVDYLWYLCSPAGYQILVSKAISTAQVGTAATIPVSARLFAAPRGIGPGSPVTVNGH
jgi:hypothetical protein